MAMDKKEFEQRVLDQNLTAQTVHRDPACGQAMQNDPANRQSLEQIDTIRQALGHADPADQMPEPTGGWAAFENRLAHAASQSQRLSCPADDHAPVQHSQAGMTRGRLMFVRWAGYVAAAAAIAIAIVGWWPRLTHTQSPADPSAQAGANAAMVPSGGEVNERLLMFREINSVFESKAAWVATADGEAEMGLGQSIDGAMPLIVIRLTLGKLGAADPVSQVDMVIVAGQQASVTVPIDTGLVSTYQIDTTAARGNGPASVSVWAQLRQADDDQQIRAALATRLNYQPGAVQRAGQIVESGQTYTLKVGFGKVDPSSTNLQPNAPNGGGSL